jgi:hypothetical protein
VLGVAVAPAMTLPRTMAAHANSHTAIARPRVKRFQIFNMMSLLFALVSEAVAGERTAAALCAPIGAEVGPSARTLETLRREHYSNAGWSVR